MGGMDVPEWDVFDVFDLAKPVAAQLARFSSENRSLAMIDLMSFFEVVLIMIMSPNAAYSQYAAIVSGLTELNNFLHDNTATILVIWNSIIFKAKHDEFGGIAVTAIMMRRNVH